MEEPRTCRSCGTPLPGSFLPGSRTCVVCAVGVWARGEDPYRAAGYCGADPDGRVRTTAGDARVVLCASSSVNYYRGASRMPAARNTGSLVEAAAAATGCVALAASAQPASLDLAANPSTPEAGFVAALGRLVVPRSFVIDVRGMRDRSFAVCVGTGPVPDERTHRVSDAIAETCARRGLDVAVNEPFAALPPWTVSHYAQTVLGVAALQVQFSASLRDPARQTAHAQVTLTALMAAVNAALRP